MNQTLTKKPIIGITIDRPKNNNYSSYPWYALRENYANSVAVYGGIPILLPYNKENIDSYAQLIDGLLITGGDFDIDPLHYGQKVMSDKIKINNERTDFEIALLERFMPLKKPILGICGGMQLINVFMGGSLIQDIEEQINSSIHQQKIPNHIPSHNIRILKETFFDKITETPEVIVNSTHHQAIHRLGKNIMPLAVADDGIVEAIQVINHKFCIGVQWHPEYLNTDLDKKIFQAFLHISQ